MQVNANQQTTIDIHRIVKQYHTELLRVAFFYLKDRQLAEDAVQEAFINVYKYQHSFRGESSEKTWIVRITINACKQMLRSSWVRNVDSEEALAHIEMEDDSVKVDNTVIIEVMKLPIKYKDVILLFYYQDFTIKEIARALEISENAARVRLNRARTMLNKTLKEWYFDV